MIMSFSLEFDDEEAMRKAVKRLWEKNGVTGEVDMYPLENGRWRLDVHSEKTVRDSTIESLGGTRVKPRTAVSRYSSSS